MMFSENRFVRRANAALRGSDMLEPLAQALQPSSNCRGARGSVPGAASPGLVRTMISKPAMDNRSPDNFEMRRLESLSNTVFGVAMTLLAYDLPRASPRWRKMCS
jgi:hypothetical protein